MFFRKSVACINKNKSQHFDPFAFILFDTALTPQLVSAGISAICRGSLELSLKREVNGVHGLRLLLQIGVGKPSAPVFVLGK